MDYISHQPFQIYHLCEEFIKSYDSILLIVEQYIKDKDGKLLLQELKRLMILHKVI